MSTDISDPPSGRTLGSLSTERREARTAHRLRAAGGGGIPQLSPEPSASLLPRGESGQEDSLLLSHSRSLGPLEAVTFLASLVLEPADNNPVFRIEGCPEPRVSLGQTPEGCGQWPFPSWLSLPLGSGFFLKATTNPQA